MPGSNIAMDYSKLPSLLDWEFASHTLAEIRCGIELLTVVIRRAELNEWLHHKVRPMFE